MAQRSHVADGPRIEERPCQIRDVLEKPEYGNILVDIGPADAGLIYRAEHEKATIITDYGRLANWAAVRSVPAVLLKQIGR